MENKNDTINTETLRKGNTLSKTMVEQNMEKVTSTQKVMKIIQHI